MPDLVYISAISPEALYSNPYIDSRFIANILNSSNKLSQLCHGACVKQSHQLRASSSIQFTAAQPLSRSTAQPPMCTQATWRSSNRMSSKNTADIRLKFAGVLHSRLRPAAYVTPLTCSIKVNLRVAIGRFPQMMSGMAAFIYL